ncbi:hypothetical protein A2442_02520 [Candidatus Campbellbacteria bacterium RIFOXYC2_FULL_35_25]|uniref:Uncharacterized protein n=1 Tax=Candidatus Campbellbacteria bacterium RIFOXYC2_FULL_35_25 TaxID=1797582 RepID=A0A1F5EHY3_9BACT|nr:MAG: hypothetical protein A2442_02520 [Candidatus Campbellbacteria bacterium RIFOXYC2_FULL_35_25]
MKKSITILINTLALLFFLVPGLIIFERIFNYFTSYLLFRFSENFLLIIYAIIGFVLVGILGVLSIYAQEKKRQNIFVFVAILFSSIGGIVSGYFNLHIPIPTEDLLFSLYGISWLLLIGVLILLGKVKDITFDIIKKNIMSKTYPFYKILVYGLVIIFYIKNFTDSDGGIASLFDIQNNFSIQVFSFLVSFIVFWKAEKIIEILGRIILRMRKKIKSVPIIKNH